MVEKIGHIKNPLTVIAIFAAIAEISGTTVLPFIESENQGIYIQKHTDTQRTETYSKIRLDDKLCRGEQRSSTGTEVVPGYSLTKKQTRENKHADTHRIETRVEVRRGVEDSRRKQRLLSCNQMRVDYSSTEIPNSRHAKAGLSTIRREFLICGGFSLD